MELEGIVHNGVIVPNEGATLPEGTRVRFIAVAAAERTPAPPEESTLVSSEETRTFGERYAKYKGAAVDADLPEDFSRQHEHYTLGTPKR